MLLLTLLLACDEPLESLPPTATLLDWAPCDRVPGSGDGEAECTTASVPWDHEAAGGQRLDALVKRVPSLVPATGQLWLLHGGPGASAIDDLHRLPEGIQDALPSLTLYAVDHRGVGGTARLGCAAEALDGDGGRLITEAEWPGCLEEIEATWGEHLPLINTTQSAHDLVALIEQTRVAGQTTMAYAGSYGTALAQRLLLIRPDLLDAVVLDGVVDPTVGFRGYDAAMDTVGQELMAACAADRACGDRFEGDPTLVPPALLASLDAGHCPESGFNADLARNILGAMLLYDKVRDTIPAVLHRLQRCEPHDVDAVSHLLGALGGLGATPASGNLGTGSSEPLFFHVGLSEMWFGSADLETVLGDWRTLSMSTGLEVRLAARLAGWPRYTPDPRGAELPAYTGPLLILQGGLDAATPDEGALRVAGHFTGETQHTVFLPQGAHGIVGGAALPDETDCGDRLLAAFLADPEAELDLGCVNDVLDVQFDGYTETNRALFGTVDAWEGRP